MSWGFIPIGLPRRTEDEAIQWNRVGLAPFSACFSTYHSQGVTRSQGVVLGLSVVVRRLSGDCQCVVSGVVSVLSRGFPEPEGRLMGCQGIVRVGLSGCCQGVAKGVVRVLSGCRHEVALTV